MIALALNIDTSVWVKKNPLAYFQSQYGFDFDQQTYDSLHLRVPFWTLDSDCIQVYTKNDPNEILFGLENVFFEAKRLSDS